MYIGKVLVKGELITLELGAESYRCKSLLFRLCVVSKFVIFLCNYGLPQLSVSQLYLDVAEARGSRRLVVSDKKRRQKSHCACCPFHTFHNTSK